MNSLILGIENRPSIDRAAYTPQAITGINLLDLKINQKLYVQVSS